MSTSYDVSIWNIAPRKNTHGKITSYKVRWRVDSEEFIESFKTSAAADSYRSDLVSAQRKGEAFDIGSGLPASMARRDRHKITWYQCACQFVDMKWPKAAATYRRSIAEALASATVPMLKDGPDRPADATLRSVLRGWAFNTTRRTDEGKPEHIAKALTWIERNSRPVADISQPKLAQALHDAVITRLDGKPYARSVAQPRRTILNNAIAYAVERGYLEGNPLKTVKWTAPRPSRAIDRRRVPNPIQARTILYEVPRSRDSGKRLYACYSAMYFAALRPEEAIELREHHLKLPTPTWSADNSEWEHGWGEIYVENAAPTAGAHWTDSGKERDQRGLKHREPGEGRHVPCPPELTRILRQHVAKYHADGDGRLFRGDHGGDVPAITWNRVWRRARQLALTPRAAATPLAYRPYDLRHAAVSTWLNGGVDPTVVAEWAGHSVEVLMSVYAKCLDGQDVRSRRQVQAALGHGLGSRT